MFDLASSAVTVLLSVLSGTVGAYATFKILSKSPAINDKAIEIVEDLIQNVAQDTELQQKIYIIGGILGQGIAKGTGLANVMPKQGSKQSGGLITDLITNFLQGRMQGPQHPQQQTSNQNTTPGAF